MEKVAHTVYTVVNPKQGIGKETIDIGYYMAKPHDFFLPSDKKVTTDIKNLIKLKKFRIKIDDGDWIDINEELEYNVQIKTDSDTKYDILAELIKKGTTDSKYVIHYDNRLVVDVTEVIYVPVDDWLYSKRLKKPTKYCSIFYQYQNPVKPGAKQIKLQAMCFCTLQEYSRSVIINDGTDYVEVICDNWLLPSNGICIIHLPYVPDDPAPALPANTLTNPT